MKKQNFFYDANGNRIRKEVVRDGAVEDTKVTFYVRDAQGNVMGTYERTSVHNGGAFYTATFKVVERPIYGSERIGLQAKEIELATVNHDASETPVMNLEDGLNEKSSLNALLTGANRKVKLLDSQGSDEGNSCDCELTFVTYEPQDNRMLDSTTLRLHGLTDNGLAVAEDDNGFLKLFAAIVRDYKGESGHDRLLLFNQNRNLLHGSEDIQLVDPKSKPLIAKLPGSESQYALVTISKQDQKPYYHLIDLSLPGHGTAANPRGEVISVNNPITSDNHKYGRHLTAKEDLVNNKTHIYHYRYLPSPVGANPGQTELLAYTFSGTGTPQVKTMTYLPGRDSLGLGELQISGDGTKLAYYNRNQLISAFVHQEVKLHVMTLNSQNTGIQGQVISYDGKPSGNYEKGAIEFTPEGDEFYHSQRGVFLENQNPITNTGGSDKNIWLYDPTAQQLIATIAPQDYLFRELVRAKNDTMYTPLMLAANDTIDYLRNGIYGRQGMSTTSGTFELASNLPTQPYRLSGGGYESEFAREVGNKQYELKDHLGNVRVVVKDIKTAFDADNDGNDDSYTASILSFNDYYPFGQVVDSRRFNDNLYDYGFNGMREDNEWKGEGNSLDFGARIYSPRIGRWLSTDAFEKEYAPISTYSFSLNSPSLLRDIDGNLVVDREGNPVTINVTRNEDGTYSATFEFVEGTTEKVKKQFENHGGKLINNMIKVPTGREMLDKVQLSPDKTIFRRSTAAPSDASGYILGNSSLTQFRDGDMGLMISVYEGSIEEVSKLGLEGMTEESLQEERLFRKYDLSHEDKVGSVTIHETVHVTNEYDVNELKNQRTIPKNAPEHEPAYEKGRKAAKEYKEYNDSKSEDNN